MTSKLQLSPMLDVETPRGRAYAFMVEDAGELSNLMWTCILRDSGEVWTFKNPDIRAAPCETMKIRQDPTSEVILPGETREQMLGRIGRQREYINQQRQRIQDLESRLAEHERWQRAWSAAQPDSARGAATLAGGAAGASSRAAAAAAATSSDLGAALLGSLADSSARKRKSNE